MTKHPLTLTQYIDGKAGHGTGKEHEITNPFDNSSICKLKTASKDEVDFAIENAHATFKSAKWKKMLGRERGELLSNLARIVKIQYIKEYNIGHSLISDAIFDGIISSTNKIYDIINR